MSCTVVIEMYFSHWEKIIHKDNENKVTIIGINPSLMKLTIELNVCFSDNDVSREVSTDIS